MDVSCLFTYVPLSFFKEEEDLDWSTVGGNSSTWQWNPGSEDVGTYAVRCSVTDSLTRIGEVIWEGFEVFYELCEKIKSKHQTCLEKQSEGRELDYDVCEGYTDSTTCADNYCYWNPNGLPAPGVCTVDICMADADLSGRITGADLSVFKRELGRMDCPCNPGGDLCQKYSDLYDCCRDLNNTGRNLDYDDCISYATQSACENANCYWNTQGLPPPGVCIVDICLADNDFSGRITGGDLGVFKKELGRMDCPCNP